MERQCPAQRYLQPKNESPMDRAQGLDGQLWMANQVVAETELVELAPMGVATLRPMQRPSSIWLTRSYPPG